MKQTFSKHTSLSFGDYLFDDVINHGYSPELASTGRAKKLSQKLKMQYLADLGSGSPTERESAYVLHRHNDKSPEFLSWMLKICNAKNTYLESGLVYSLFNFMDDKRVLPSLVKSARKCPDEEFFSYAHALSHFGGAKAQKALLERYVQLKNNPKTLEKAKYWNDLATALSSVCDAILRNDRSNIDVADTLLNLAEHPNRSERERVVHIIISFYSRFTWHLSFNIAEKFAKKLTSLLSSRDDRMFVAALPFLFEMEPKKTYEKFKKTYLKYNELERRHFVMLSLSQVTGYQYWVGRLIRELPAKETTGLKDEINSCLLKPMTNEELSDSIRQELNSASPYTRIMALKRLEYINHEAAHALVKTALKNEPDELIQKQLREYLKKGK